MLRYVPLFALLGLMIYCLFDVIATDRRRFRSLNKPGWLLVVLLPVIGAILWLALGRPPRPARGSDSIINLHRRDRPVAPDDNPEFLRDLEARAWRARREQMLKKEAPSADPAAAAPDAAEESAADQEHEDPPAPASD